MLWWVWNIFFSFATKQAFHFTVSFARINSGFNTFAKVAESTSSRHKSHRADGVCRLASYLDWQWEFDHDSHFRALRGTVCHNLRHRDPTTNASCTPLAPDLCSPHGSAPPRSGNIITWQVPIRPLLRDPWVSGAGVFRESGFLSEAEETRGHRFLTVLLYANFIHLFIHSFRIFCSGWEYVMRAHLSFRSEWSELCFFSFSF